MCRKLSCVVIMALSLSSDGAFAASDDAENAQDESTSFASRILAITDVVLQKHIDPPTRQQMILAGTKALYHADKRQAPKGLSGRVSDLASPDEISEYFDGVRAEFNELQDLEAILTNGMFEALPGRASLIDAKTSKVREQLLANRYVGLGIALKSNQEERRPQIAKVFYNAPAWKAGVRFGDVILEIDGKDTASKKLSQVVQELRGEDGSEVTIVVRQPDSQKSRTLTITLGRVFIPSVQGFLEKSEGEWQYTIDSAKEIALIRIVSVGPSTLHELRQAEAKLRREDIRGIVLDLRGGSGTLHEIIMVADSLLDGGVIGHIRSLDSVKKHEARPGALFHNIPMAVLVAKYTSAGNVFLTAALQDHERAIVVGEPTTGETYVRSIMTVPGRNNKIVMATAVMLRGDGTPLLVTRGRSSQVLNVQDAKSAKQKKRLGFIMPDHVVITNAAGTPRSKQSGDDPILAKAIEVLRSAAAQAPSRPKNENVAR